eukprot:2605110-Pleurochrysis_carterae.AAC.1
MRTLYGVVETCTFDDFLTRTFDEFEKEKSARERRAVGAQLYAFQRDLGRRLLKEMVVAARSALRRRIAGALTPPSLASSCRGSGAGYALWSKANPCGKRLASKLQFAHSKWKAQDADSQAVNTKFCSLGPEAALTPARVFRFPDDLQAF